MNVEVVTEIQYLTVKAAERKGCEEEGWVHEACPQPGTDNRVNDG